VKTKLKWVGGVIAAAAVITLAWKGYVGTIRANRIRIAFPAAEKQFLDQSSRLVLYSLEPIPMSPIPGRKTFHGYTILGQTPVGQDNRNNLLSELYAGVAESPGLAAACFNPRHGIRASRKGETMDLVICFQCSQIHIHTSTEQRTITTSKNAQPYFNQVLRDARVKLPNN